MGKSDTLATYIVSNRFDQTHFGAKLWAVTLRPEFSMKFLIPNAPPKFLTITALGLEDWCIAPDHGLLEGTNAIELVPEDPKLSRAYLESLDCEGSRTDYPERVQMLRHGCSWVIAAEFLVEEMSAN